ncbi:hypothetical protein T5B8_04356 [Salinisphaera sp. T5B8]|uniref:DoxX family protein n=1 Tax=Salinisphaera sp. T5B8 TaxID=1304154 RepID=UPI0033410AC4
MSHALSTHSRTHLLALLGIAAFFLASGIGHFLFPDFFLAIVPDYIPMPAVMVAISGLGELLGAIGILMRRTRRLAGFGLLLLTLAVFPANVYMAQNPEQFSDFAPWLLYARLPLQLLILLWIAYAMRRARSGYGDFY